MEKVKYSLEEFTFQVVTMNFQKLGEELLNPNNWDLVNESERKEAYQKAWETICLTHGSLFKLLETIDLFRNLNKWKDEKGGK